MLPGVCKAAHSIQFNTHKSSVNAEAMVSYSWPTGASSWTLCSDLL